MNYIENIYICLAAPLLVSVFCLQTYRRKVIIFILSGMTMCLLSSYISSFVASVYGLDASMASVEVAPIVEEIMKLLPVVFYLLVFEPEKNWAFGSAITVAIGFATFENVCYLLKNDASNVQHLIIRGFGTGTMHIVTGMLSTFGIQAVWEKLWLRVTGTMGLLSIAIVYHSIYNLLVSQQDIAANIGYFIPIVTVVVTLLLKNRLEKIKT